MPRLYVPTPELLRRVPECGALALLDFGLGLADSALRLEHPIAGLEHTATRPAPTKTLLLAELLVARCLELRRLIAHYNAALDDALGRELDFDADPDDGCF